jgi:hypothetical protein
MVRRRLASTRGGGFGAATTVRCWVERSSRDGSWCAVPTCLTPRMQVTAARPPALIAAISDLLPTTFMTSQVVGKDAMFLRADVREVREPIAATLEQERVVLPNHVTTM